MFKLEFSTENAAFDTDAGAEAASILRGIASKVMSSGDGSGTIFDSNGNRIGVWSFSVSERDQ